MSRPACKYGAQCYRRNPSHFDEFSHPAGHLKRTEKDEDSRTAEPASKTARLAVNDAASSTTTTSHNNGTPPNNKAKASPYGFYLTMVPALEASGVNTGCLSLAHILRQHADRLTGAIHFNFMVELDWLLRQFKADMGRTLPQDIVVGESGGTDAQDVRQQVLRLGLHNINVYKARIHMPYGTHHTKMTILLYSNGLRVLISTCNLIERDWTMKTQALYITPLLPKQQSVASTAQQPSDFQSQLLAYLQHYGPAVPDKWMQAVRQHDFSGVKAHLIGSVPGRHTGAALNRWGHLRLRQALQTQCTATDRAQIVAQFSSIGSLGPKADSWLTAEFLTSLSASSSGSKPTSVFAAKPAAPKLSVVYPCVEDVRTCLEGYEGGGSLPYRSDVARKQPYLRDYMHKWVADRRGRTHAMPHVKSYARFTNDDVSKNLHWFLLTSANLSKAAWGELQKQHTQLCIRSYELGVLFVADDGKQVPADHFLPFDWPLTRFGPDDQPWVADGRYTTPDVHGRCTAD